MPLWGRAPRARLNKLNKFIIELRKLRRKRITVTRSDTLLRGAADSVAGFCVLRTSRRAPLRIMVSLRLLSHRFRDVCPGRSGRPGRPGSPGRPGRPGS